jgi:hypothetical protein
MLPKFKVRKDDFPKMNKLITIAILASFVNFLLPPRGFGEGRGGVKIYDSCKDWYI